MERKAGEEFYYRGVRLKVVEHKGCQGCYFLNKKYECEGWVFMTGRCHDRNDGKTVIFKKSGTEEILEWV